LCSAKIRQLLEHLEHGGADSTGYVRVNCVGWTASCEICFERALTWALYKLDSPTVAEGPRPLATASGTAWTTAEALAAKTGSPTTTPRGEELRASVNP
jgi:hypothetical protein